MAIITKKISYTFIVDETNIGSDLFLQATWRPSGRIYRLISATALINSVSDSNALDLEIVAKQASLTLNKDFPLEPAKVTALGGASSGESVGFSINTNGIKLDLKGSDLIIDQSGEFGVVMYATINNPSQIAGQNIVFSAVIEVEVVS